MNNISDVLIYQIPFARTDKYTSQNINNNFPSTNAKNEFSIGLYFCSLILKKDFNNVAIKYVFNKSGKPSLESEGCEFSISYTNDYVYIAMARDGVIGLDAEQINSIDLNVSKEFMSESELIELEKSINKYEYFYKIWTLKEAYVKLIGTGIDSSIVDIEFIEDKNGKFSLSKEKPQKTYFSHFVAKDCIISIASFNLIDSEIINFDSMKDFLKKYEH